MGNVVSETRYLDDRVVVVERCLGGDAINDQIGQLMMYIVIVVYAVVTLVMVSRQGDDIEGTRVVSGTAQGGGTWPVQYSSTYSTVEEDIDETANAQGEQVLDLSNEGVEPRSDESTVGGRQSRIQIELDELPGQSNDGCDWEGC